MTLIVAFKCAGEETEGGEGILITADTRESGIVAVDVQKITPVIYRGKKKGRKHELHLALAAGAGRTSHVRQLMRVAEQILLAKAKDEWELSQPSYDEFEHAMDNVQDAFMERIALWREKGVDADVGILICGLDSAGKASMYEFDSVGMYQAVHSTPGFSCLGRGFITGGDIILKQFWDSELTVNWGLVLSAYAINMVSLVDPSVGPFEGSSFYFRLVDGKPLFGELKSEMVSETVSQIEVRGRTLKEVWDLCDLYGDKRVARRIQRLKSHWLEKAP